MNYREKLNKVFNLTAAEMRQLVDDTIAVCEMTERLLDRSLGEASKDAGFTDDGILMAATAIVKTGNKAHLSKRIAALRLWGTLIDAAKQPGQKMLTKADDEGIAWANVEEARREIDRLLAKLGIPETEDDEIEHLMRAGKSAIVH